MAIIYFGTSAILLTLSFHCSRSAIKNASKVSFKSNDSCPLQDFILWDFGTLSFMTLALRPLRLKYLVLSDFSTSALGMSKLFPSQFQHFYLYYPSTVIDQWLRILPKCSLDQMAHVHFGTSAFGNFGT
jgi:hypothetical protein